MPRATRILEVERCRRPGDLSHHGGATSTTKSDDLEKRLIRVAVVGIVTVLMAPSAAVLAQWRWGIGQQGSFLQFLALPAFFSWLFFIAGCLIGAVLLVASPASRRNPWLWLVFAFGAFGQSKFSEVVGHF